jgi:hypothetical protein
VRDLDVTAAYGIEAACPRNGQPGLRLPDSGQPVTEPSSIAPRRCPSSPLINAAREGPSGEPDAEDRATDVAVRISLVVTNSDVAKPGQDTM